MNIDNTNPNFIALESIQIAAPCHADWDKMSGDDQSRFCGSCAKNVYNLSAMSRAEAQRLIQEKEGNLCVQLHRRADGTVITSDCPVGISPAQRASNPFVRLMAAIFTAGLGLFGMKSAQSAPKKKVATSTPISHMLGRMAIKVPATPPVHATKKGEPVMTMGKPMIPALTQPPVPVMGAPTVTRGEPSFVPAPSKPVQKAEPKKGHATAPSGKSS